jgi:HAE1 family hydrophobic/amphiphilic exporter-1
VWFIRLCIERPVFVIMIESLLLVLGVMAYQRIGVDLYPKIDPPIVTVTTVYAGAGPEEIETLISKKIEEEVNQIGGMKRLVSTSQQGVSRVIVEFNLEVDAQVAQNEVRDKVLRIRNALPADIEEPMIERLNFEDRPILTLALTSTDESKPISHAVLRMIADQRIKPQLQKVSGVGQINLFGGREREVQVVVDRLRLQANSLSMSDVSSAIRRANLNTPSGEIGEYPNRRTVRVMGEFKSVRDIEEVIIKTLSSGQMIRVKDVATVEDGLKEQTTLARLNGDPAVMLEIKKQSDANTVAVAEAAVKRLDSIAASLDAGLALSKVYDGSRMIRMSVHDVIETIVIAGVLAIVVVYFFLGSLQSTLITGIALPCTVIASFFVLHASGFTLNIMTLLGLTLSVGLILDDAIVIRENIWNKIEAGLPAKEAAFVGTKEVMVAVLATSLTVLAVFFPVSFIPGIVGRFFAAFALTVCIGIILSTFDAVTMAPMLSANLMRDHAKKDHSKPNRILAKTEAFGSVVAAGYARMLKWCLGHPKSTIFTSMIIFVVSIGMLSKVGFTFLPENEAGEIEVSIEAQPGTSFDRMSELAQQAEAIARGAVPEIEIQSTRVGRHTGETNFASIFVQLTHYSERDRTTSDVKNVLRQSLRTLAESHNLTLGIGNPGGGGQGKPLTMVVQGPDNLVLQDLSAKIINQLREKVAGVVNLDSNLKPGRQEIQVDINRQSAAALGLRIDDIGANIRGTYEGLVSGVFREKGEEYDIRARIREDQRSDSLALDSMYIPNDRGDLVPLGAIATRRSDISPTSIVRIDQRRSARIEGDLIPGTALANVVADSKKLIEPMLPAGYSLNFQGQAESLGDLRLGAISALALGALLIYMVMASLYESFVMPFAILVTLPLAIIGAIVALLVSGKLLDIYGVIGIILLMALVTKNAILVVDYAEQLRAEGKTPMEAIYLAGIRRMRPIVMTSIAMIAGMLPVAIGYGELNKVRSGMGVASIGGLISSTLLSLVVIPCIYLYLDRFRGFSQSMVRSLYFGQKQAPADGFLDPTTADIADDCQNSTKLIKINRILSGFKKITSLGRN